MMFANSNDLMVMVFFTW